MRSARLDHPSSAPVHATTAYRADLSERAGPFGPDDGAWVTVASLLEQARSLTDAAQARMLVAEATAVARDAVGRQAVERAGQQEWGTVERTPVEPIILLADQAFEAGALRLARAILDALLEADRTLGAVQRGRVIARRARADGRLGRMSEAADQYREVERLGGEVGSVELQARAWIGQGALAQMRGNYPEQRRWSRRAAREADAAGLAYLSRLAHNGLMIAAGAQHRFDESLHHAAIVYAASLGDPLLEGEVLQNIGQIWLEAGHPRPAAETFAGVLRRPVSIRIVLPALGSLAVASAALGDVAAVEWADRELARVRASAVVPPYAYASAALECASALVTLRRRGAAERTLAAAEAVANAHGFYEIIVKAEAIRAGAGATPFPAPERLGAAADRLARRIGAEAADGERLPEHVQLAAAPS